MLWRNAVAQKLRGVPGTIGQRQSVHLDFFSMVTEVSVDVDATGLNVAVTSCPSGGAARNFAISVQTDG